jgi:hypothetical protein
VRLEAPERLAQRKLASMDSTDLSSRYLVLKELGQTREVKKLGRRSTVVFDESYARSLNTDFRRHGHPHSSPR